MPIGLCLEYKRAGRPKAILGIYSSRSAVDEAIVRFRSQPELRDYLETFTVGEYELDRDEWSGGGAAA